MRLDFNIVCFEDRPEFLKPIFDELEEHLDEYGFYLRFKIYKDSSQLDDIIEQVNSRKLDVDLIIMDYLLANNNKGDQLIRQIRSHNLLTDIIFYSADPDFLKNIGRLDGVFAVERENLESKLLAITNHLLRKEMDISNFRGLVMAETSELDYKIIDIASTLLNGNFFPGILARKQKIKDRALENSRTRVSQVEKAELKSGEDTVEFLTRKLDAALRGRTLMDLLKAAIAAGTGYENYNVEKLKSNKFVFEDYRVKVLAPRNNLAHAKESINEKGQKVLTGWGESELTEEATLEIRKNLMEYHKLFSNIQDALETAY